MKSFMHIIYWFNILQGVAFLCFGLAVFNFSQGLLGLGFSLLFLFALYYSVQTLFKIERRV